MINVFVGWFEDARQSVRPKGSANAMCARGRDIGAVAGVALTMSLFATAGAQAQNCTIPATTIPNLGALGSSPASVSSMIGGTITAAETAFLLQSTAFVGSPSNPAADQQGGGIWVRGVGGTVDIKSSTSTGVSTTGAPPGFPAASATVPCTQKVDESFGGVQFGADTAKLNVNGWNFHLGTTAGFLGASGTLAQGAFAYLDGGVPAGGGPFTSNTQIPFIGEYAAATNGGFAIDALLRTEYYQNTLNAPGTGLFNQPLDGHGISFSSSATYQWHVPDSKWFIEPSAGIIISRVKVDPFNFQTSGIVLPFVLFTDHINGTLQLNDIKSDIGRVGLRAGTTIDTGSVIWQPFAAVSVWHEFGPNLTSNYSACPGCALIGATPTTLTASSSTSTFGTYGQYSLGISAALAGTGWLGFARVDYRDGPNLQGLSGTGGIRYQFTPDMAVASRAMPVKAPVYKAPVMTAVNWTGFYIGGFGGATQGKTDWGYPGGEVSPHVGSYLAGGDFGYNYQTGRYVFGVEVDIAKTHTNGATACGQISASPGVPSPMFEMTCNAWADWVATATARAGYTWDRALFYVKGGGAWTNEQFSATCNLGPLNAVYLATGYPTCTNPAGTFSNGLTASSGRGGWTIGTGTEFALTPHWSAKAEADYVSFGDTTVTASDGSALKVGMHYWEEKIGLNYRFSSGPDQYFDLAALTGSSAPSAKITKAPAPPVFSWTGFYIGGNAGAVASVPSGTSDFLDSAAVPPLGSPAFGSNPEHYSSANSSFLGGFQAGYNWQVDPRWVVGVEADWDWTHTRYNFCRQTDVSSSACNDNGDGFESIGSRTDWLGTARARAGVTLDGILLYGTGGAAWGRVVTTLSQSCLVVGCGTVSLLPQAASSTSTTDKMGWVAGVGAEYALSTNWSAKAEWLYIDLGTINNSLTTAGSGLGIPLGLQTTTWSRSERYDELHIGVNYKFGHSS
jgi:opacity protein-like surface antigen